MELQLNNIQDGFAELQRKIEEKKQDIIAEFERKYKREEQRLMNKEKIVNANQEEIYMICPRVFECIVLHLTIKIFLPINLHIYLTCLSILFFLLLFMNI